MNWTRIIIDGIIMAAYFNIFAALVVAYNPRYMMSSYPKAIRQTAQPQTKRELRFYRVWMYLGELIPLMLYASISTAESGMTGYWNFFLCAYIQWNIISFADFVVLDIVLLQKMGKRMMVPGTEGHPDYRLGNWLKKVAVPEHFLGWPLILAPVLSFAQAGLTVLWSNTVL